MKRVCATPGCKGTMGDTDRHKLCSSCRKEGSPVKRTFGSPTLRQRKLQAESARARLVFGWLA